MSPLSGVGPIVPPHSGEGPTPEGVSLGIVSAVGTRVRTRVSFAKPTTNLRPSLRHEPFDRALLGRDAFVDHLPTVLVDQAIALNDAQVLP